MNAMEMETVIDGLTFDLRTAIYKASLLSCDGHYYWDSLAPREQEKIIHLLTLPKGLWQAALHVTGRRKTADGTRKYSNADSATHFELLLSADNTPAVHIADITTLALVRGFIDVLIIANPDIDISVVFDSSRAYAGCVLK